MCPLSMTHLLRTAAACVRKVSGWRFKEVGWGLGVGPISIVIVQRPSVNSIWESHSLRMVDGRTTTLINLLDLNILLEVGRWHPMAVVVQENPCNTWRVRFELIVFGKRMKGLSASVRNQSRSISRMTDDDVGWDGRKPLDLAKAWH